VLEVVYIKSISTLVHIVPLQKTMNASILTYYKTPTIRNAHPVEAQLTLNPISDENRRSHREKVL